MGTELQSRLRNTEIRIDNASGPDLQAAAQRNNMALHSAEEELKGIRKELQSTMLEMKNLRSNNEALKRNLNNLEDRSNREIEKYQNEVRLLKEQCYELKREMAEHLRQYQHLQGVKVALDMEISMYRKLLEEEETRLDSYVEDGNKALAVTTTSINVVAQELRASVASSFLSDYDGQDDVVEFEQSTEKATLLSEMSQLLQQLLNDGAANTATKTPRHQETY